VAAAIMAAVVGGVARARGGGGGEDGGERGWRRWRRSGVFSFFFYLGRVVWLPGGIQRRGAVEEWHLEGSPTCRRLTIRAIARLSRAATQKMSHQKIILLLFFLVVRRFQKA